MYASHAVQAAASASIPLWAVSGAPPLALILAAAFIVGSGRVFADAAAFGAVASVVGAENFTRGQSALSAVWSIGILAGPAVAGVLVAAVGPSFAITAEASALVVAAAVIAAVRTGRASPAAGPDGRQDVRAGIRATYLAMAGAAAVSAIAIGAPLIGRAASLSR